MSDSSSSTPPPTSVNFIRKAEDEVYEVATVIGKDAAIVEKVAVAVEQISAKLKSDVIKAKDVVHEINKEMDSIGEVVDKVESTVTKGSKHDNDSSSLPSPSSSPPKRQMSRSMSKSRITNFRYWDVLKILIHVLVPIFSMVQLWPTLTSLFVTWRSGGAAAANGSNQESTNSVNNTSDPKLSNWSLLYGAGPLIIAFNLIRRLMTSEKKIISKLEENVDELASEVTKALEVVDDVAHVVEHASKKVEEETDKVQRFITEHKVN